MNRSFYSSRAFSTFGDEVWRQGIPIYLSAAGLSLQHLGWISGASGVMGVLGFVLVSILSSRYKASLVSAGADALCCVLLMLVLIAYFFMPSEKGIVFLVVSAFVIFEATSALWTGSTEVLIPKLIDRSSASQAHNRHVLGISLGNVFGSALAPLIVSFTKLLGIISINLVSFIWQIIVMLKLAQLEKAPMAEQLRKNPLRALGTGFSPAFRSMTLLVMYLRFLFGITTFVASVSSQFLKPWQVAACLGAYAIGSVLGGILPHSTDQNKVSRTAATDSALLVVFLLLVLGLLQSGFLQSAGFWIYLVIAQALVGVFLTRYSISLRVLRHLRTPSSDLPDLIASQGVVVRLGFPLSGPFFGYLLGWGGEIFVAAWLALLLLGIGLSFYLLRSSRSCGSVD